MKTNTKCLSGVAMLEFLLVFPVLLIMAYAAIEFGAVFTRLNTLTKTVHDATRYLSDVSVNKSNTAAQQTIAVNLIKFAAVGVGNQLLPGTYNAPIISNPDPDHVQITAVYNHTPVVGATLSNLMQLVGGQALNLSFPLTATTTMRYVQ